MRYTLTGSTATLALTVANTGDKALPFSVGFHRTSPPASWTTSRLTSTPPPAAKVPRRAARRARDHHPDPQGGECRLHPLMTGVKSPMRFTDSGNGHKVTVSFDESVFHQRRALAAGCRELRLHGALERLGQLRQ